MIKIEPSVEIIESYKDYEPPINATAVVRKLIDNIPPKYVLGLDQIVITNQSGLPRRELRQKVKSRKRKVSMDKIRGFYYSRTGSDPAWIEIYIDKISYLKFGFFQRIAFLREFALSKVLYHEVGHHIHTVILPEHSREQENIADEWQEDLWRYYIRKKYWYLMPLFWLLWKISQLKVLTRYHEKIMAEYKEKK